MALRDVLPQAIYLTNCPDHLLDAVRREVLNAKEALRRWVSGLTRRCANRRTGCMFCRVTA